MKVTKKGWNETAKVLQAIAKSVPQTTKSSVRTFAQLVRLRIRLGIMTQSFKLAPLTKRYLRWKIARGYDRRILIRSGRYLDSIIVRDTEKGSIVGIDDRMKTTSGEPMWKLAAWLEYGTKKMLPRPHWRPTIPWINSAWPKYMQKVISQDVRRPR